LKERILLDTGPLVAWLDEDDQWHEKAVSTARELTPPFLTCDAVLTEACFLLQKQPRAIAQIAAWLEHGFIHVPFNLGDSSAKVFALMAKYRDLPMSLADACLVTMVETGLGERVFTLDRHFKIYRQRGRRVVPLLMPE
jgi:predicted nucleic acid-binding protein